MYQIFAKSPSDHFYNIFPSFRGMFIGKMSSLVLAEILGVFVRTLSAHAKYPLEYDENLQLPIQIQLYEKQKPFSQFFVPFLESTSNFKYFEAKNDGHS